MQFQQPLIHGKLIKRYKRFLADVLLDNGEVVTAHCPNTGAMTNCMAEGWSVWLSKSTNPKRKLGYTWELSCDPNGAFIGVNTQRANQLIEEALNQGKMSSLIGYEHWQREVKYGQENSKIDFLLTDSDEQRCYLEVKSVTLLEDGIGYFPDAVTTRGQKHLRELMQMVTEGHHAAIVFCAQHTGIKRISPAKHIDPNYADLCRNAAKFGVEFIGVCIECNQYEIRVAEEIPIFL